jgi:hypothetical protein
VRSAAITITLGVLAIGCGGTEPDRAAEAPAEPCPADAEPLAVRDLIERPPRGYVLGPPADDSGIGELIDVLRQGLGGRYRGHDAAVLARRRADQGVFILVLNSDERSASEGVIAGAQDAERENDLEGGPIEVDGREGRLVRTADGSFMASAPAGECAVVMLLAGDRPTLRHAASLIRAGG